jgi:ATPase subunit of ABC transporter with duplicated ATPase domains
MQAFPAEYVTWCSTPHPAVTCFVLLSHDRHVLAALSNRVLELTPEGIHQFGGGYSEYVARTGHEAPGLRS